MILSAKFFHFSNDSGNIYVYKSRNMEQCQKYFKILALYTSLKNAHKLVEIKCKNQENKYISVLSSPIIIIISIIIIMKRWRIAFYLSHAEREEKQGARWRKMRRERRRKCQRQEIGLGKYLRGAAPYLENQFATTRPPWVIRKQTCFSDDEKYVDSVIRKKPIRLTDGPGMMAKYVPTYVHIYYMEILQDDWQNMAHFYFKSIGLDFYRATK